MRAIKKGQIEAIVFTVLFLAIAMAAIIGAIIALVGMRGAELQRSTTIMSGTSRPISFSEGLVLLQTEGASMLEQALHIAVSGRIPAKWEQADKLPLSARMQDAIAVAGFEDDWRLAISNTTDRYATAIFELGTFPTFCGELPNSVFPQDPANKWAWCEDSSKCAAGRTLYSSGQQRCKENQQCCLILYNFSAKDYYPGLKGINICGPDENGWRGTCRYSCVAGEVETANSTQCPGRAWGFLRENQLCCRPVDQLRTFEPTWLDTIAIPLLYADASRSMAGKIELWLGEPKYESE